MLCSSGRAAMCVVNKNAIAFGVYIPTIVRQVGLFEKTIGDPADVFFARHSVDPADSPGCHGRHDHDDFCTVGADG